MAVLTLRKIEKNPRFRTGAEVKIKRSAVVATRLLTNVALRHDSLLRGLFGAAAAGLPRARLAAPRRPRAEPLPPEASDRQTERPLHRSYGSSGS